MKRILIFLLLIFSISLVSAGECTAEGFDNCWDDSRTVGGNSAFSRIMFNFEDENEDKVPSGEFGFLTDTAQGGLYYKADFVGQSAYLFRNPTTFDEVFSKINCGLTTNTCFVSGFDQEIVKNQRVKLADVGNYSEYLVFVSLDKNGGAWTASAVGLPKFFEGQQLDPYQITITGKEESNLTTYLIIGAVAFLLIFATIKFNLFGKKKRRKR